MNPHQIYLSVLIGLLSGLTAHAQWLEPAPVEQPQKSIELADLLTAGDLLHPTLETELMQKLPADLALKTNPQHATDQAFVEAIARYGSQGRLDGDGMRGALFAQYTDGSSEIGFYGLAADNESVAAQREQDLRKIWAHNHGLDRTHIHRQGAVLLVVWIRTADDLPEAWHSVKAWAAQRLLSDLAP